MQNQDRFGNHWQGYWPVLVLFLPAVGCFQPVIESGPSYAELVVTYNAELEALDRLEGKRDKLIKEYAVASAPDTSADTLSQLEGLLKSASDLNDDTNLDTNSDPEAVLDDLTQRSEEAQEVAGQLLDGLLGGESDASKPEPSPETAAAAAERKATFEAALMKLDAEIAKQKERVDRARQARDAAEAKSQSPE